MCHIITQVYRPECSTNINLKLLLDPFTLKTEECFLYDRVKGLYTRTDCVKAIWCDRYRLRNPSHFMGVPVLELREMAVIENSKKKALRCVSAEDLLSKKRCLRKGVPSQGSQPVS